MNKKQYTYDQVGMIFLLISFAGLSLATMWRYEDDIERFQKEIEHNQHQIDSLVHEIDTLIWDREIWEHTIDIQYDATNLLSALIMVESMGNDSAHAKGEDAVGCLQIRKTMVDDVNRILKRKGKLGRFTYNDRWMRYKSIQMFEIYCDHYNLTSAEEIARCWNGGPRGMYKNATTFYWNKVQNYLDS